MTNTLKDWTARPVDLATTAARKAPHSAHLKYGESAAAEYPKKCGDVYTERAALPAGLHLSDMPFSFTDCGALRSADRRAVALDDWRYTPAAWSYWRAACRVRRGFADAPAAAYYRRRVLSDRYLEFKRIQKSGGGADAWALVTPAAVRAWLALVDECGGPDKVAAAVQIAPAYACGGEVFFRMTEEERDKLAEGRRRSKTATAERLEQQKKSAGVAYFQKIYHYINVGAPAAPKERWRRGDTNNLTGSITDTGGAVIAAACRRWGAQALAGPIRRTGSPWLLALRAQQYQIDARQAALEYATGALMGGAVVAGLAPALAPGISAGGRRYKVNGKLSVAGSIKYKERRRRSSTGALESAGQYALEEDTEKIIKAAQNRAAVGVRATELDAIINSCACPCTDAPEKSLMFWLARDCGALDDVVLPMFRKRAFWGACQEINGERGDYARSARGGVALVSLEELEENGGAPAAVEFDSSGLLLADVVAAARAAAPVGREDVFEKFVRLRICGYTRRAAAEECGVSERTGGKWQVRIVRAAAAAGLAEAL